MGQGGLGSQLDLLSDVAALVGNNQNQFWYDPNQLSVGSFVSLH
jgi:hypothetical protein